MNYSFKQLLEPMTILILIQVLRPTSKTFLSAIVCVRIGIVHKTPKCIHFVVWTHLNEYLFLFADGSRIQPTSILRGSRGRGGPLRPFGHSGPVGLCPNSLRLDRCMLLSVSLLPLPLPVCSPSVSPYRRDMYSVQ